SSHRGRRAATSPRATRRCRRPDGGGSCRSSRGELRLRHRDPWARAWRATVLPHIRCLTDPVREVRTTTPAPNVHWPPSLWVSHDSPPSPTDYDVSATSCRRERNSHRSRSHERTDDQGRRRHPRGGLSERAAGVLAHERRDRARERPDAATTPAP